MSILNGGFGYNTNYNNQQYDMGVPNLNVVKINNGGVYFVTFAPVFTLFFESVAGERISALFLWIFSYILCVLVCKYDKDRIILKYYDTTKLNKLIFIPVLYLYLRYKSTKQCGNTVILCLIALFLALLRNGYVSYYVTSEESYIVTVENYEYTEFMNKDDVDNYINASVSDVLGRVFGDTLEWTFDEDGYQKTVCAKGNAKFNNKTVEINIVFEMWYDGYKFDGIYLSSASIDTKTLPENEIGDLIEDLYLSYYEEITNDKNVKMA